jgi:dTDP-4-dehydrorhamnose 3,5-epimerase
MIDVQATSLAGVLRIVPDVFEDHRGEYIELFDSEAYLEATGGIEFVQDDVSVSYRGVLRGIHGDSSTTKLVMVLAGEGYAIIADNRPESPTYKQWEGFELNRKNRAQLLLPPGIGNSVVSLSDELVYYYKQDTHWVPGQQFTIRWTTRSGASSGPSPSRSSRPRDLEGAYVE